MSLRVCNGYASGYTDTRDHAPVAYEGPGPCPMCERAKELDEAWAKVHTISQELALVSAERDDLRETLTDLREITREVVNASGSPSQSSGV